jgi:DNA-directed RNA polymerase specialized sigma24 family protein
MEIAVSDAEILDAIPYAAAIATPFRRYGDAIDWREEALLGLVVAARAYRPGRGCPYRPFALWCVKRRLIALYQTCHGKRSAAARRFKRGLASLADFGEQQDGLIDPKGAEAIAAVDHRDEIDAALPRLTARQAEVCTMIAEGATYAIAAQRLGIARAVVGEHIRAARDTALRYRDRGES